MHERLLNYLIRRALCERSAHYVITLIWRLCREIYTEDNEVTTYYHLLESLNKVTLAEGKYTIGYAPADV